MKYVDMNRIEQNKESLSDLELEVRSNISHDPREAIYSNLDLEEALKTLSKRQRECFELVIEDGYTEREAAQLLGISNDSLHVYIKRAKEKLKIFLGGVKQKA
jgi:RNA polymerase sigma factor (sigma-70 family)